MINRYRGDTHAHSITLKKDGALLDLDLTDKVEFAFDKAGTTIIILCIKDVDPLTGKVTIPFTDTDVDTAGNFTYDVQVTWLDTTKTTFSKATITFKEDINKT